MSDGNNDSLSLNYCTKFLETLSDSGRLAIIKAALYIPDIIFENDNDECIVCMDQVKDTIFYPCGHFMVCKTCTTQITKCPTCRSTIIHTSYKNTAY